MAKRAIVTGGTGFVGANLVRRLMQDGHDVHLIVRAGRNPWRINNLLGELQLHEAELVDPAAIGDLLKAIRPQWIFHLATHGAYPHQDDARQMVQTNVTATVNLVDAAIRAGVEAFVNTGSSSEYGFKDHGPSEEEALEPNSAYAVTKAAATLYAGYQARRTGAPIVTLRLYSVYGPYEEPTRLVPQLLVKSRAGSLPPLVDPDVARDYVYVDDVSDAFLAAASAAGEHPGAVYNIGTGVQTALREIVDIVRRLRGLQVEPQWGAMPRRSWDSTTWVANNHRARAELGWRPQIDLERGVRRMAEWLDENPPMLDRYSTA